MNQRTLTLDCKVGATAIPEPPAPQPDRRIFCARFPVGWDNDEIRVEALSGEAPCDVGRVVISTSDGHAIGIEWHQIEEISEALAHAGDDLWKEHLSRKGFKGSTT
jgi:hypothetical protein